MMTNENYFLSRLFDLDHQAESYYMVTYSSFLDLHEQSIATLHRAEFSTNVFFFGGHELAERQMIAFLPDDILATEFPIDCLKISPRADKFADTLTHRDYLGAILNTGIERKLTGDIFIKDHNAYLLCINTITDYLIDRVQKIKHTAIKLERCSLTDIQCSKSAIAGSDAIASNRLDCIVSSVTRLSRQKAQTLIQKEVVSIDHQIEIHNDFVCPSDCVLSIKGYGRFRIIAVGAVRSKKGKLRLEYEKYV